MILVRLYMWDCRDKFMHNMYIEFLIEMSVSIPACKTSNFCKLFYIDTSCSASRDTSLILTSIGNIC